MTETTFPDPNGVDKPQHELHPGGELESEMPSAHFQFNRSRLKLPQKEELSILLVGETGSGKTSFLSLVLNLLKGNGPFELVEQHDTTAESGLATTQSQTTKARLYSLTTTQGAQFQIIDTPGLADTRGMDKNNTSKEQIFYAVKELIKRVDAVMLVINGRNERLSTSTSYTLETLAILFPRSIKNNIGIIFTNTEPEIGPNFSTDALPPELRTVKCWCVENPLSRYKKQGDKIRKLTESQRSTSKLALGLIGDYNEAVQTLNNWLEWLDNQEAVPTTAIIELYRKSNEIESRLFDAILLLENLARLRRALEGLMQDTETAEKSQKSIEVRNREPPEIWTTVETSTFNTICFSPDCYSNCHVQCSLEVAEPAVLGSRCTAFRNLDFFSRLMSIFFRKGASAKCSRCNHKASEHRNYQRMFNREPNEVHQKILRDLQGAQLNTDRLRENKARVGQRIKTIEQSIEESKLEIPRLVEEMNNVSLSPNYAGYIRSAIELFELHQKHLQGCADSDQELIAVNSGITMFKNHLALLKNKASDWVTSLSSGVFGKQAFDGSSKALTVSSEPRSVLDGKAVQEHNVVT